MKLLFLTQVIDEGDAILGFVPRWIEGLARRAERVRVVALEAGRTEGLPDNADVRVVGRRGRVRRWLRYRRILAEAFSQGFDTVLAHMIPRYALVAAGPARRAGAGLYLWYTHGGVDARLLRAVRRVDKVFTASAESMRVETDKKVVTGHGIDVEHFDSLRCGAAAPDAPARVLAVGRMTPSKDPLTVLGALGRLVARGLDVHLDLVGGALAPGDEDYGARVARAVEEAGLSGRVHQHGAVPYPEVPEHFRRCTLLVNASYTGSVDKVVLEAMSCRRPVLTCNESFGDLLGGLGPEADELLFEKGDDAGLARRMERLLLAGAEQREALGGRLRAIVERDHEVEGLLERLFREMGGGS